MLVLLVGTINLRAQGTAFTYQGRLTSGTIAANGSYDLTFSLFSVSSGAGQVGSTYPAPATPVSNGLFTVALDFGANFPGANRWLEIGVRTNGSVGAYTTLSPRQALTATPYAIMAGNAGNLGGQSSTAFAPATGSPSYVAKAGDTMTGSLNIISPQHALAMTANGPDVTFNDTAHSNARDVIQSVNGDLNFFTESYLSGANSFSFLKVANNGNVGIGSAAPVGKLEVVGQDALRLVGYNPFLTLLDSNAGYARSRIQGVGGDVICLPKAT